MKPRFKHNRSTGNYSPKRPRSYRPSARDLVGDSELSRGEFSFFLVLGAAVVMAFLEHAQVARAFVQQMPEFASAVANLVRNLA